jgi:hypothetical protein
MTAIAVLAAGLIGCGGGGSSGGGPAGLTQPPSTPVAVTATNATQVGATALEPAIGGSGALGTVVGAETTAAPKPRAVTRTLLAVARDSKERLSAPQSVVGVAQTFPCTVSGSVTVDAGAGGTSATITFNACSDIAGETTSGSASLTGVTAAADGSSFSATFSIDVTFTETGAAPLRIAGGFSIGQTCNITTLDCSGTFTGTSLGAAQGTETWFITNFTITEVELAGTITTTLNYTVSSSALNGSVSVITSVPLKMLTTALHPYTGVVIATGSNNSKVRVTVLGSHPTNPAQVQIEVDADGNGVYESSTLYSWSTLDAL